ncbi:MAG: hypothetical protein O7G85_03485 [Planctomycetota bacterium]|nr:hypothetical protein [Planctomycetota bacterium]
MKGMMEREFIAQLVIILAVSLGGWMMLVQPKARQLHEMEAVFLAVTNNSSEYSDVALQDLADMLTDGRQRIDEIDERNKLAENTTLLYSLISGIGADNDVMVQSLTPGTRVIRTGVTDFSSTRIDIVLEGKYEKISQFFQAIRDLPGFIRPFSLTMKPAGEVGHDLVVVNLSCELLEFPIPENLNDIGVFP